MGDIRLVKVLGNWTSKQSTSFRIFGLTNDGRDRPRAGRPRKTSRREDAPFTNITVLKTEWLQDRAISIYARGGYTKYLQWLGFLTLQTQLKDCNMAFAFRTMPNSMYDNSFNMCLAKFEPFTIWSTTKN